MKELARPLRALANRNKFVNSTIREPSAWIPLAMSFAALATVLVYVAMFGVVREADEGTPAHIFQLLMVLQVPVVAFFAIKWLPSAPKQALMILGLQIVAVLTACAPVFLFKL
jgi:hypothetical protein